MKRTHSSELQPRTPPVITGTATEENPVADTQASGDVPPPGTPVMRTPEADDGTHADWRAANWLHDELPDELADADALLQMMPHTPPVARPRSPQAESQESIEEDDDSSEDGRYRFETSFRELLNPTCAATTFSVDDADVVAPSPEERKALVLAIASNTSLQTLELQDISCNGLLAAVAEGMASNSSIRTLNLNSPYNYEASASCPAGSGVVLAQILATNSHLTALNISGCHQLEAKDYLDLFRSLKDNCTLEDLDATRFGGKDYLQIGAEAIDMLAANRSLKAIGLPWGALTPEAFEALGKLLHMHPTLARIDLGTVMNDGSLAYALGDALTNGTRITTIVIDCIARDEEHSDPDHPLGHKERIATVFEAIAQCPGLKSVHIANLLHVDCLLELLRANPGISQLVLRHHEFITVERIEEFLQQLAGFVQGSNQITDVSYEQSDRDPFLHASFLRDLHSPARGNLITHTRIPSAGMGISVMLGVQRNEPQALPEFPLDVTRQLAEAVVRNLTAADTRAVFDAVTPYAEVSQPVPDALHVADCQKS